MIRYRPAIAADVPTLLQMLQGLAEHDGSTSAAVASEASLLQHGFGRRPLFWAMIAEDAAQPLGMAIYYPDYSTHRGQPGVYVQDIFVADTARGLGVGRGLLAQLMHAQDWQAQYLTLGVSADNAIARGFYQRLGFRVRGYEFLIIDGSELEAL